MARPQFEFCRPAGDWRPALPGVAGMFEQILSEDPETGDYTRLVRMDPGTETAAAGILVHDFHEEVYIVEGDLTDVTLGETFTAGMYCNRLPGMAHGPYRSDGGNLLIEFRHGLT